MQPGTPFPGGDAPQYPPNVGPFAAGGPPQGPPPAASNTDDRARRLGLGDVLAALGGLLIILFSFAPFVSYSDTLLGALADSTEEGFAGWYTAWSPQMFMAPLTWFAVMAGLILMALAAVRVLAGRDPSLLGTRASQAQFGAALFAFLVLLGYAVSRKQTLFGFDDLAEGEAGLLLFSERPAFAWGGMVMLVGAMLGLAGAVLNRLGAGPSFGGRAKRSPERQWPNAGPGYPAVGPPTPGSPVGPPTPDSPVGPGGPPSLGSPPAAAAADFGSPVDPAAFRPPAGGEPQPTREQPDRPA